MFDIGKIRKELIIILKTYVTRNRLRVLDLFNQWDKDKDDLISVKEFRAGVKDSIPTLTNYQIDLLADWFDPEGTDGVDYRQFVTLVC